MFYFIKGIVAQVMPNLVVIDAGGVGYGINTSYQSASSVKSGDNATFYTYLHVREDIFDLYGFVKNEELSCFKQLINISGVGPKAALAILGVVTPGKLALAVVTGDEKALCAAPGIGKKMAQRIILELKDKMAKSQMDASGGDAIGAMPSGSALDDAVSALNVLGYSRSEALSALNGIDAVGMNVDEIVRTALKRLF